MASFFPLVYYSTFFPFDRDKTDSLAAIATDLDNLYNGSYVGAAHPVYPPAIDHEGFQNVSSDRKILYSNTGGVTPAVGQPVFTSIHDYQSYVPAFYNSARNFYVVVSPLSQNGTETILTINSGVITAINTHTTPEPTYSIANIISHY